MIFILQGQVGGEILISVEPIHMQVYKLSPFIGRTWQSLYFSEKYIFVVSIHPVNIGGQSMAHIYLVKMQPYAYLIIYMRMRGNIEENKKVIANLHRLRMKKKRIRIIKEAIRINKEKENINWILDLYCTICILSR